MNKIKVPEEAIQILKTINEAGFDAYVVGGCVRDSLLGKEPNDWDITTSAMPQQVKKLFKRTIDTGIKHGTVTILMKEDQYEVTTYRIDGEYLDGRHPENVTFTNLLSEDLRRRDFTINAMAYHPKTGLVDLYNGVDDLEKKIVRCVGSAVERFSEDALRMMRAIRFAAQLGFSIEDETFAAIKKLSPTLEKISGERIREEMLKLLVSDNPMFFKKFYETGLTAVFMPEFDKAMETEQNHPHHMYSVGEHILHSIDNIEKEKVLRLAMLFHDIAKPVVLTVGDDGITHFYGHPDVSAEMAKKIMDRLKFDNATMDKVCRLAKYHDRNIEVDEKSVRRSINKIGNDIFPELIKVRYADIKAQSDYLRQEKLDKNAGVNELYEKILAGGQCFTLKDLAVTGKDIIAHGVLPGPGIGDILDKMLDDVLDNPEHNDKEYLLKTYVE